MRRRRLAFAMPLVLVVACRTPPAVEPGEGEETEEEDGEGPVVVNAARPDAPPTTPAPMRPAARRACRCSPTRLISKAMRNI